jgi:hypothetical protein
MASYFTTSIASGQWFYVTDADPNAVITANRGSVALRIDAGNVALYLNTDNATAWAEVTSSSATGTVDWTGVSQVLMADNSATALAFGSTGLLNLLQFVTTDAGERLIYNGVLPLLIATGGLTVSAGTVAFPAGSVDLALSALASANLAVASSFVLRLNVGAGLTATATLPARAGGWLVTDCWIVSGGASAGSVTVNNVTAAAAVSNGMLPGNATKVTRTTDVANATFAGGGQLTAVGVGNPASVCYVSFLPL